MTEFGPRQRTVGRGAVVNPPNRFERLHVEADYEHLAADDELLAAERRVPTEFFADDTQSILSHNDSPDLPFRHSINPYRGCEHGCAYCYARPTHEYLGFNAGLDFETRVMVKTNAADLLRRELAKPSWKPELIAISGVTDCYQPAERKLRVTRSLLEVLLEAKHPCGIVTKNALVLRDLDLLRAMAAQNLICVNISLNSLDGELKRKLEPHTSAPAARLDAIRKLAEAGVPVRVLTAPIIPGLNDHEIPELLAAVKEAGAHGASFTLLRLPLAVLPVFTAWLETHFPERKDKVLGLIRSTRDGKLSSSQFGERMRGTGEYAAGILHTFEVFARKLGLDRKHPQLDYSHFRAPRVPGGQGMLF